MVLEGDGIFSSNVVDTQCKQPYFHCKPAISGRENSTIIIGGTVVDSVLLVEHQSISERIAMSSSQAMPVLVRILHT